MRHADLRREAIAVIAKAASALLYATAAVVPGMGVWACVFCGGISDAMGLKNTCTTFD